MTTAFRLEDARQLDAEVRARLDECKRAAQSVSAFLDQAVADVRLSQLSNFLIRQFDTLLNNYGEVADRLVPSIKLVVEQTRATISTDEKVIAAATEPVRDSIKALRVRAERMWDAENGELETVQEQLKQLLGTDFETSRDDLVERWKIMFALMPAISLIEEFYETRSLWWTGWRTQVKALGKSTSPPAPATIILAALTKPSLRDGVLGDAEEQFSKNLRTYGHRWADFLYWVDAIWSVGPLLGRLIVRLIGAFLIVSK
jgi:hypothetical protein